MMGSRLSLSTERRSVPCKMEALMSALMFICGIFHCFTNPDLNGILWPHVVKSAGFCILAISINSPNQLLLLVCSCRAFTLDTVAPLFQNGIR
jgi:hypothetical protein